MDWYKFNPVDTLFFRGAEPMIMGENHTVSHVFPPPAHTLSGALRTAVLIQNGISLNPMEMEKRLRKSLQPSVKPDNQRLSA